MLSFSQDRYFNKLARPDLFSFKEDTLLAELLGADSPSIIKIRDYPAFDLGTKVLYLERSTKLGWRDFFQAIDKLYQPHISNDRSKQAHLIFLRAFCDIQALCMHTEVKLAGAADTTLLEFILDSNGLSKSKIDLDYFKKNVQKFVDAEIKRLSKGRENEVAAQRTARLVAEINAPRHTSWRLDCDLPRVQLEANVPLNRVHFETLKNLNILWSIEQYVTLPKAVRALIENNLVAVRRYLLREKISEFDDFKAIAATPESLQTGINNETHSAAQKVEKASAQIGNLNQSHWHEKFDSALVELPGSFQEPPFIAAFLKNFGLKWSVAQYQSLPLAVQQAIANNFTLVKRLFLEGAGRITFDRFQSIVTSAQALQDLLLHYLSVIQLANQEHMPLTECLSLSAYAEQDYLLDILPPLYNLPLQHAKALKELCEKASYSNEDLLALDPSVSAQLIKHSAGVVYLVTHARIQPADLLALENSDREFVLNHPETTALLAQSTSKTLAELLNLKSSSLDFEVDGSHLIVQIMTRARIAISAFLVLEPFVCIEILKQHNNMLKLLAGKVVFSALLKFDRNVLLVILKDPNVLITLVAAGVLVDDLAVVSRDTYTEIANAPERFIALIKNVGLSATILVALDPASLTVLMKNPRLTQKLLTQTDLSLTHFLALDESNHWELSAGIEQARQSLPRDAKLSVFDLVGKDNKSIIQKIALNLLFKEDSITWRTIQWLGMAYRKPSALCEEMKNKPYTDEDPVAYLKNVYKTLPLHDKKLVSAIRKLCSRLNIDLQPASFSLAFFKACVISKFSKPQAGHGRDLNKPVVPD